MATRHIAVAAVQIDCQVGCVDNNLEIATDFIEVAAQRGAQLVLLPELTPSGYQLTETLWDCAEPFDGRIVGWLTSLAQRLWIYLGTTFLEAADEDFFNTLVLATPDGAIAGRVRKSPPASLEAYFCRAGGERAYAQNTERRARAAAMCRAALIVAARR